MAENVLVTGSSQGIGLSIAKCFNKDFNVYIAGRYKDKLENLCSKYGFKGYAAADLKEAGASEKILSNLGVNIDILINNAGVYFYNPIEKMTADEINDTVKINMLAPFMLSRAVIPYMKRSKRGRIINIGSISGVMGEAYASAYSMTKAALTGLTKALALETAQDNITVNIINPGWADTELICNENLEENFTKDEILETIPGRRFVTPDEIAQTCLFLASDSAKSITGQSINICAGLSLGF